jgi:hypothetical protein
VSELPTVVSEAELSNSFLGALVEICIVTADHRRTMERLVRYGGPGDRGIRVCFADTGGVALETMEPARHEGRRRSPRRARRPLPSSEPRSRAG